MLAKINDALCELVDRIVLWAWDRFEINSRSITRIFIGLTLVSSVASHIWWEHTAIGPWTWFLYFIFVIAIELGYFRYPPKIANTIKVMNRTSFGSVVFKSWMVALMLYQFFRCLMAGTVNAWFLIEFASNVFWFATIFFAEAVQPTEPPRKKLNLSFLNPLPNPT